MSFRRVLISVFLPLFGLFAPHANATPESEFWQWFQKNDAMLFDYERDQEKVFDLLAAAMQKVHPSLTFEFGPKEGGRREFVISADGIREAFPKVESLYASAPRLQHWKFIKFRPRREPLDLVEYGGASVKPKDVTVVLRPQGKQVALTVLIPGYPGSSRDAYVGVAYLLLDQALGEYDVETRVGRIDVATPGDNPAGAVPLSQLPRAFDAHFASRR